MKRRLFIGIDVSSGTKTYIKKTLVPLHSKYPAISWIPVENLHITLAFLGYTTVLPALLIKALQKKLRASTCFPLELGEVGEIVKDRVTVVWEVTKSEELFRLYHMVGNVLVSLGFHRNKRTFHPHVTLGRSASNSEKRLPQLAHTFTVSELTLFDSHLKSSGAHYHKLGAIILPTHEKKNY